MPRQVEHRLILHHLARCHEDAQDSAACAAVHHIMRLVAQMRPTAFETQWRGVRVSRTDAEVGGALVETMLVTLLPTAFRKPVMSGSIGSSQRLTHRYGKVHRQRGGGGGAGFLRVRRVFVSSCRRARRLGSRGSRGWRVAASVL